MSEKKIANLKGAMDEYEYLSAVRTITRYVCLVTEPLSFNLRPPIVRGYKLQI